MEGPSTVHGQVLRRSGSLFTRATALLVAPAAPPAAAGPPAPPGVLACCTADTPKHILSAVNVLGLHNLFLAAQYSTQMGAAYPSG